MLLVGAVRLDVVEADITVAAVAIDLLWRSGRISGGLARD